MSAPSHPIHENRFVLEKREGGVATLILNRPERMNALNKDLVLALNDALTRVEADEEINVVVLAGAGRAFCAGGDLPAIAIRAVKQTLFGRDREELIALLDLEVEQQMKCFLSGDCDEGIRAFFEKRAPKFQG